MDRDELIRRLAEHGLELPPVPAPVAAYVPAVRSGAHVYVSGQLPWSRGELLATGLVGADVDVGTAVRCAEACALNALAAAVEAGGDVMLVQTVKLVVYVACQPGFTDQPRVADGASALLGRALGAAGQHARSAVGVAALPLSSPVELDLIVEVG